MKKLSLLTLMKICIYMSGLYGMRSVYAQDAVPGLSDLVGAKAGQAESVVDQRGYTSVNTEKSGGSSYSYWTETGSNKCVAIRTEEGRYQSIVYAPNFDWNEIQLDTNRRGVLPLVSLVGPG